MLQLHCIYIYRQLQVREHLDLGESMKTNVGTYVYMYMQLHVYSQPNIHLLGFPSTCSYAIVYTLMQNEYLNISSIMLSIKLWYNYGKTYFVRVTSLTSTGHVPLDEMQVKLSLYTDVQMICQGDPKQIILYCVKTTNESIRPLI